jgi:type I restriction enzyme, S subunit
MSWTEIELGKAIHVKHGFAFKGEHFVDEGELVVLTPGNFYEEGGFRARPGKDRAYAGDVPDGYVLNENDLIVAMTEQGEGLLGSSALVPEANRYLHNQRIGLVDQIDEELLDRVFLYYLFNTKNVRGQIGGSATGTKVRHTAPERIYRVFVRIPEVTAQIAIAKTLRAYDELIENNKRRIDLLEQSARLLYKEWFVRLQYPGHEHDEKVRGLPAGWKKQKLSALAEITMGQSPASKHYNQEGIGLPFHQGVTEFGHRFPENKLFCAIMGRIGEAGDILFSVRAPVGRINITLDKIVIGRGLAAIRSRVDKQSFLFYALKDHFFKEDMLGSGAIFASITKKDLHSVELKLPRHDLVVEYERIVAPIDAQIKKLHLSVIKLAKARDLLMPRLLDGRISI